jgi:uncharacterized protein YpbB
MPSFDQIDAAHKLKAELVQWQTALQRLRPEIFKLAELTVQDAAHGHMGQQSQTKITLHPDKLRPYIEREIERLIGELREIGFEP